MMAAAARARARGQLYRFLAAAFLRPPTAEFVAPFLKGEVLAELADCFSRDVIAELERFRHSFDGDYESLDQDYQSLFVIPLGRYVTPYEAVYRDERVMDDQVVRGLLMGPSTLAVKALYREAGLAPADEILELPDHVGLELGCMQALCDAEAAAWERGESEGAEQARALQRRMLEEHLLQWVPALCARISENAPGPFYRGIAALTEAFLEQEMEGVGRLAGASPEGYRCD